MNSEGFWAVLGASAANVWDRFWRAHADLDQQKELIRRQSPQSLFVCDCGKLRLRSDAFWCVECNLRLLDVDDHLKCRETAQWQAECNECHKLGCGNCTIECRICYVVYACETCVYEKLPYDYGYYTCPRCLRRCQICNSHQDRCTCAQ